MTRSEDSKIIKIVHPICCGLDVHKESISACVLYIDVIDTRSRYLGHLRAI